MNSQNLLFEQEYFEKYYADYTRQNPPKKMEFYRSLIEGTVEGIERPRILELGCAFGKFLGSLDPKWDRYGQDISEFAIERARRSIPAVSAVQGPEFAVSSITHIPFVGPFDTMVSFDVLEHVEDLDRVASVVREKLSPSGHFIFVVPVYDGPTSPLIHLLDKDITHIHKKSRAFWLDWGGQHFRVNDWWGIYRFLTPFGFYIHRPTKVLRRFTPAIAVVASMV